MTTGATGQLGLALPVQGELSGTWGDTVNNGITQYTNIAIAATLTLTDDGAVTLANTTGDASASNITSSLTGAGTVTAQFAIVKVTGTLTTAKVITAPSYSKTYVVVNAATGGIVTFKASGQTGVSIAVGESAFVYYNGTDYVKVAGTTTISSQWTTTGSDIYYNTGNVGIGTSSPAYKLDVVAASASAIPARLKGNASGNNNTQLRFAGNNSGTDLWAIGTEVSTSSTGTAFDFYDLTAGANRMRLDSAGNLGLGVTPTNSAGYIKMQINGTTGGVLDLFTNGTRTLTAYSGASSSSFGTITNTPLLFQTNDSERMRLDSAGNLGVGTTSPANPTGGKGFEISNASGASIRATSSTTYLDLQSGGSANYILSNGAYPLLFYTNSAERARIDSSGNLLLGVTSSTGLTGTGDFAMPNNRAIRFRNAANSAYLNMIYVDSSDNLNFGYGGVPPTITFGINGVGEVSRFTSAGGFSVGTTANPGLGAIYATGNITAYYSSDIKFKENVRDIPDALATVNAIGGKLFDWTDEYIESKGGADGYFVQKADFGVVAQDVQKVFPIAVRTRPDGSLAVDYEKLGALAFAALVELTKRVEALEAK